MIRNDCVVFYHASPVADLEEILPQKTIANDHGGKVSGQYACLASSPAQAFYWAGNLGYSRQIEKWHIYEVRLEHEDIVENCVGRYHFEGGGRLVEAIEVFDHEDVDGEVCVFHSVPVVGVFATVEINNECFSYSS